MTTPVTESSVPQWQVSGVCLVPHHTGTLHMLAEGHEAADVIQGTQDTVESET